jgi:chorismate synthase
LQKIQNEGDTIGGEISCLISGVPAGWGEPVFDKLQADLAKAMMSIGTAKGFEYGLGFDSPSLPGSRYNDSFTEEGGRISTQTNHDGGIQGGISNGEDIYFRVAFKPVPSHHLPQKTIDSSGVPVEISNKGRHDSCHVPRLVVVVESMAALVLADHSLRQLSAGAR